MDDVDGVDVGCTNGGGGDDEGDVRNGINHERRKEGLDAPIDWCVLNCLGSGIEGLRVSDIRNHIKAQEEENE